jgi:hypothetical protein
MLWPLVYMVIGTLLSFILNLRFGSGVMEKDFLLVYYGIFVGIVAVVIGLIWFFTGGNPGLQSKVGNWFWAVSLVFGVPVAIGGVQSLLENSVKAQNNARIQTRAELVFPNDADGVYGIIFDEILEPSPALKDKVWTYNFGSSDVLHIKSGYFTVRQDRVGQTGDSLPRWLRLHTRLENGKALSFLQCQCTAQSDGIFVEGQNTRIIGAVCRVKVSGYTLEELNNGAGGVGQDLERILRDARAKPAQ